MTKSPETRYTDTHLSLWAFFDLRPLALELERIGEGECKASDWRDGEWSIYAEPRELAADPEQTLAAMLDVIEGMSADARRLWDSCYRRTFEFGYTSGARPWTVRPVLSHELLIRIVSAGVGLRFYLYEAPSRKGKRRHQNDVHYKNTDLEARSWKDLSLLRRLFDAAGWGRNFAGDTGNGEWLVVYEVSGQYLEPELTMLRFLDVLEVLNEEARELWDSCHLRELDIGLGCGDLAYLSHELSLNLLRRIVKLGISLPFTMYAREKNPSHVRPYARQARFVAVGEDGGCGSCSA